MADYTIFQLGDQAVTFSLGNSISTRAHGKVMAMKGWLQHHTFPGLLDIVIAYSSLTIVYDLWQLRRNISNILAAEFVRDRILEAYEEANDEMPPEHKLIRIAVCYEHPFSPDLDFISAHRQIPKEDIIGLHTSKTYQVYMIGFLPGFPYLAQVDERIAMPRKEKPRTKVEAGSVGIAGIQTGIYPVDSPGGWQIVGRTPLILFDQHADPPAKLAPGDQVQFYAISKKEFSDFNSRTR